MPTFATGLMFSWSADLIVITALLGSARFLLALAGLDVGTAFGGIGSSPGGDDRLARRAGDDHDRLHDGPDRRLDPAIDVADFMSRRGRVARLARHGADRVPDHVAVAENGRIPVDNPATHLELTMVHEAMVLEYSGRHLALIDLAASLKLVVFVSLIACIFAPVGMAVGERGAAGARRRHGQPTSPSSRILGALLAVFETVGRQDAGVPRPELPRHRADAGPARHAAAVRLPEPLTWTVPDMPGLQFDIAHMLAGGLVLVSLMMLYQDRLYALLNMLALHAFVLALSVAWQAYVQDAPHLYITAVIALVFKAMVIPMALRRMVFRLGIHREIETVVGIGLDHARGHRAGRAVAAGHAAGDPAGRSAGARGHRASRCRSCCSACS